MTSPAEHAATVREWLHYSDEGHAALDALQAQAEMYESVLALLRETNKHYEAVEAERDRLAALVNELEAALRHLAEPNWQAKATGQDAKEMAGFARAALAKDTT